MENILYNELMVRQFSVDVGVVYAREKNEKENSVRTAREIDFVVNSGGKRSYIQSAYAMPTEEKSETKSRRTKTAEKTDKTKAGEKTNTTKEEKTAKTKTGARISNDKTAEKSVKAKADTKKTESASAKKPGRRGRKKKEETKETDK